MRVSVSRTLVLLLLATSLSASQATAQFLLGPRAGIEIDDLEEPYLGIEARFGAGSAPLYIVPSLDYFFIDSDRVDFLRLGVNAIYEFELSNTAFVPYAGGGLNVGIVSVEDGDGDTDVGLNVLGGLRFLRGGTQPFLQLDLGLTDPELVTLGGGLLFTIGN